VLPVGFNPVNKILLYPISTFMAEAERSKAGRKVVVVGRANGRRIRIHSGSL
jgi:hypothetical protein